jgi:dTDP-L-rhamnose 4-epimerase
MERPALTPEISFKARSGDIRHNIADIAKIRDELGFTVSRDFNADLIELAEWVAAQQAQDHVHRARSELEQRGLVA